MLGVPKVMTLTRRSITFHSAILTMSAAERPKFDLETHTGRLALARSDKILSVQ